MSTGIDGMRHTPHLAQPGRATARVARATRARRGLQWLIAVLLLCEWRVPRELVLQTEQRSARSATSTKLCRKSGTCVRKAVMDSLTYLSSSFDAASMLRRWPDDGKPIPVWIAHPTGSPRRAALRRNIARDAFHTWTNAGVPERFVFVPDSANAVVHVLWRNQLPDRRAGQVTRQADADGWLRAAVVELSVRNISGAVQDTATLRAVALHEVGHLLGLEHSPDERDIMAPWVVARRLSARDRATAQALYSLDEFEDDR